MNKEKQIEEIALILTNGDCTECNGDANCKFNCLPMYDAELLYNAGYRKADEVAEEIFAKIERKLQKYKHNVSNPYDYIKADLAELKKKYIGEDINVTTKESEKDNG